MNIVYASDNNFAEILGISMTSLFENNKECDEITVYILDDGINEDNKEKLEHISADYSRKISFIDVGKVLNRDMKQERGSVSTFSRLYLGALLPKEIDKVLYLDCDILILKNLSELYSTDISGYYIAGVRECFSRSQLSLVGLGSTDNYMNAGVLLVNVDMWRRDNLASGFEEFSNKYNNDISYADQGIVNGVMSCKSLIVDIKYNSYTLIHDFKYKDVLIFRKPDVYYSEEEVTLAKNDPYIVHFTTSFLSLRPWIEGCQHPYAKEWLRYKAMTPWADAPMRPDKRPEKKKLFVKIYKMLPNVLAVNIAGLLHARIVPALKRRK